VPPASGSHTIRDWSLVVEAEPVFVMRFIPSRLSLLLPDVLTLVFAMYNVGCPVTALGTPLFQYCTPQIFRGPLVESLLAVPALVAYPMVIAVCGFPPFVQESLLFVPSQSIAVT
jgi:hypothetical protein